MQSARRRARRPAGPLSAAQALLALGLAAAAGAQVQLVYSLDATSEASVPDESFLEPGGHGISLGLPASSDLSGLHVRQSREVLLAVSPATVIGGITASPGDVLRLASDGSWLLELQGADYGVPPGVAIDAIAEVANVLVLSFDATFALPDGTVVADEDLVGFVDGSAGLVFDGSLEGIDPVLDLDAAHWDEAAGRWLLSFDTAGSVGGVAFEPWDVLALDPGTGSWTLVIDLSDRPGVNVDALAGGPFLLVFADDFEAGDTSAWSAKVP